MSPHRSVPLDHLAQAVRDIHAADPARADEAIEAFLDRELQGLGAAERVDVLERLETWFSPAPATRVPSADGHLMERLVPLLLGRDVDTGALAGPELVERLAQALNRVFTALNELVSVIDASLGGSPPGDETIRRIIGGTLGEEKEAISIEEYLGRIRKAFLAAQQSSRDAARTMAGHILTELDPASMETQTGGFRIGPMKKAEAFERFEEKYARVRRWYDSERFLLDFLRQFEKNCQKSFT